MAKSNKAKGSSGDNKIPRSEKSAAKFKSKRKGPHNSKDSKKKPFLKKKKFLLKKPKGKFTTKTDEKTPEKLAENEKSKVHIKVKADTKKDLKRKLTSKERKELKRKKHDRSEVATKFMLIYETLRRKGVSGEERQKLIDQVFEIAGENGDEVIYKHDTVRVLEMCAKFGSEQQKEKLFQLFKDNTVNLITSKYGKFLVEKFIEHGSKEQKRKIIESFYGKVKKLIRHKDASAVIDEIYNKYANASQRAALVEEFYGPEFTVFKAASGRTLEDILEHEPIKKASVMKFMKDSFVTLCQKDVIIHSIVHRALFDFFKYADIAQKTEIIEVLKEGVVHILHTKDGAKVAMNCIWHGTVKDRKAIIKSFKTYVAKICKEEYGHLVMLALFDVIDDTVLVKKALFPEMLNNLEELMMDQYGRKVLLYLLKPRSKSYFLPDIVKLLQQGDANAHSKKEQAVRQGELRAAVLPELLEAMVNHTEDIIKNKSAAIVLLAALEVSSDLPQSSNLMKKIAGLAGKPIKSQEKESGDEIEEKHDEHPICDACGHWVVKNIVQQDKTRIERGDNLLFSKLLCDAVAVGWFVDWAPFNRGAFVLISLLETGIESVTTRVKDDLKFLPSDKARKPPIYDTCKGLEVLKKLLTI